MPSAGQFIEGVGLGVSSGKEVRVDVDTEVRVDEIRKGVTCDILTTESVELRKRIELEGGVMIAVEEEGMFEEESC